MKHLKVKMYKVVLLFIASFIVCVNCLENFQKEFETQIIQGYYHKNINVKVDANKEFIIRFPNSTVSNSMKVVKSFLNIFFYSRNIRMWFIQRVN